MATLLEAALKQVHMQCHSQFDVLEPLNRSRYCTYPAPQPHQEGFHPPVSKALLL